MEELSLTAKIAATIIVVIPFCLMAIVWTYVVVKAILSELNPNN